MTTVMALFFVLILGLLFDIGRRSQLQSNSTDGLPLARSLNRITSLLAALVITATVFLGSFFVLGYAEFVVGQGVVRVGSAAVVGLVSSMIFVFWLRADPHRTASVNRKRHNNPESIGTRILTFFGIGHSARVVTLFALAWIALLLIILPSFPRGFEASAKHLPIGLHFFQNQTLLMWDTVQSHNYPANGAIFYGFLLSFLPERLVALVNSLIVIPVFASIYGLAILCGADQRASLWSALGLFTVPIIAFNVFELEVDLAGIAFLAIAVYFIAAKPRTRPSWPVLAGLSIGIAYGIKAFHLISAIYLGVALVLTVFFGGKSSTESVLQRLKPVVIFTVAALAISSYWLIRNYLLLQNPLYPVHMPFFDLFGWTGKSTMIVDKAAMQLEWVRSPVEWFVYPWTEWHFIDQNFKATSGLGAFFATVVPVSFVIASMYILRTVAKRLHVPSVEYRPAKSLNTLGLLIGGSVFVITVWAIMGPRQPRYGIGALVFLFPLAGWTLSQTTFFRRTILDYVLTIAALIMLFVVSFTISIDAASRFLVSGQFSRAAFYEYPDMIDELAEDSTVLNLGGRSWNYPLYGNRHSNKVVSYRKTVQILSPFPKRDTEESRQVLLSTNSGQYVLRTDELRRLGGTHLFVVGDPIIRSDGCAALRELQRIDTNPTNKVALPDARILFKIEYCDSR